MSRDLQQQLLARIDTAVTILDLPLTRDHIERLAVELTPAVKAMLAEADATVAELTSVPYTLAAADGPAARSVTEYTGCVSAIHPDVPEDSPAALLALELQRQSDLVATDVPADAELSLTVQPRSLTSWGWWTERMSIVVGSVTRQGDTVTCTGHYGEVTIRLRGDNVGALLDAHTTGRTTRRAQGVPAGHPW